MIEYEGRIGLEVHVQLRTNSKMFCGCSTQYGAPPNTQVCPVCLGYPGAMPMINREAVRLTVTSGLMVGARINRRSKFDRKSYFYPDMPKNYQISQYDLPLCEGGAVVFDIDGVEKTVRLARIHLEEDVAKSFHFAGASGIDFNRAGVPLMEIVSMPDLSTPDEALAYLLALKELLMYAGVSDCNLEEGNIRCDVNCSVRPKGGSDLGTKTEIKNLNTFKGVQHALQHELARQISVLEAGGRIVQETRRWDMDAGATFSMRTKEDAHDYRYFPEPDLLPVELDDAVVEQWRAALPETPRARRARFRDEYNLPAYDAGVLAADRDVADFFEATVRHGASPKAASNWIMTEMLRRMSEKSAPVSALKITPEALAGLIGLVDRKTINQATAKELFDEICDRGGDPAALARERGLGQISDSAELEQLVGKAMAENPESVADYRRGKTAAAKFLMGCIMRMSRGRADPREAQRILEERLRIDLPGNAR